LTGSGAPASRRLIPVGLVVWLGFEPVAGLLADPGDSGLAVGLAIGAAIGLLLALATALALGRGQKTPQRMAPMRWQRMSWQHMIPRFPHFRPSFTTFSVVLLVVLASPLLVWGVIFMFPLAFMFGLARGFSGPESADASPVSPLISWRSDLAYWLFSGLVAGVAGGLGVGLLFRFIAGLDVGLGYGFTVLILGLGYGFVHAEACSASLASAQLAVSWHTPMRLMRFLEDARNRNVLRTVGPVYQFRHARLQDRLAEHSCTARQTHTRPRISLRS
jgi:hypothetical protein